MAPFLDPTFRGGDGNVGIIRSPVRAIALPDNRHEVEDERALRVKTNDLLGPESCDDTAGDSAKRRQGLGGCPDEYILAFYNTLDLRDPHYFVQRAVFTPQLRG